MSNLLIWKNHRIINSLHFISRRGINGFCNSDNFPYTQFAENGVLQKKEENIYRRFIRMNRINCASAIRHISDTHKEKIVHWCSADSLGLSTHPAILDVLKDVLNQGGIGSGGNRFVCNSIYHELLEKKLAELYGKERGLLLTSGFVANEATLLALVKSFPGCEIFSDATNHASLIHGIVHSRVKKHIFNHNDLGQLESLLLRAEPALPKIVVVESVHSMSGNTFSLKGMCELAKKYGAMTVVDEAHGVGLYGNNGAGICEMLGIMDKVDILTGSLNKAPGSVGGYIVGSDAIVDLIRCTAPGFNFTASLPPSFACAAVKAIEIISSEEGKDLRRRLSKNVKYMRQKLNDAKIPTLPASSHLIPIKVNDPVKCYRISDILLESKHFLPGINYPTVPRGEEGFRLMPTVLHTKEIIDDFVAHFERIWHEQMN